MADTATIQTRIDQIDSMLARGVKGIGTGEDRTEYDLQSLRNERDRLQKIIASSTTSSFRRVVFKRG